MTEVLSEALGDIDLVNPDHYVDDVPWAWFDRLRTDHPVIWHPEPSPNHGFWAVTRYDDLTAIHMDWETFSSESGAVSLEELDGEQLEIRKSMLETDPPRHTELRKICSKRFSARGVGKYEDWIREVATRRARSGPAEGRVRLRQRDQPRSADPVPVLDLHGAAGGCAEADRVGRQHDREPGPRPVGCRRGQGRHRGLPAAALPLPHRARRVRLRRRPAGPARRRTRRRRDPGAHDRAVRGRAQRAGVPQLLRGTDDRRQRDHTAHDQPRHAGADAAPRAAPSCSATTRS